MELLVQGGEMNPLLLDSFARQHIDELHREADQRRLVGTIRKRELKSPKPSAIRLQRVPAG
jgi:hypothetical protein